MFEDFPIGWVIFLGIAGAAMIGSYYRRTKARAVRDRWVEAAELLGFTLSSGTRNLFMSGTDGPLSASVAVKTDDSETTTRYQVEFPPLGLGGLRLTPESGWQGFLKALGGQDVEIGDRTFDDRFVVKASSPDQAKRYLTWTRVHALNALYEHHGGFTLSNDELVLTVDGLADEADIIVSTVNDVMETARILQPDDDSAALMPPPVDTAPEDRDEALQDIFETIEGYATAEGLPEAAEDIDTELDSPPSKIAVDSDALRVATRLFGDHQLGFEVERVFAAEFEGRSVDWSGTVRRPAGLMATRAFDDDTLAVLVVEVASLDDELYGTTSIDAIVAFPGDRAPQPGAVVRFTGRLTDVDGVGKDLYVSDARLS